MRFKLIKHFPRCAGGGVCVSLTVSQRSSILGASILGACMKEFQKRGREQRSRKGSGILSSVSMFRKVPAFYASFGSRRVSSATGARPHRLLTVFPPTSAELSDADRIVTFLSANIGRGDTHGVIEDVTALRSIGDAATRRGVEAILQSLLFAGFPRALQALTAVEHLLTDVTFEPSELEYALAPSKKQRRGEELVKRVTGEKPWQKLRDRVVGLQPDLYQWMTEFGYGTVLCRPELPRPIRHLCAMSIMSGQSVAPQLLTHVRGAIRAGLPPQDVKAVLDQTEYFHGSLAMEEAQAVWDGYGIFFRAHFMLYCAETFFPQAKPCQVCADVAVQIEGFS